MAYTDKNLVCKDCGKEFEFTAREQAFYAEKGFNNEPGRCPECRQSRKQQMNRGGGRGNDRGQGTRQMFKTVCSACGKETQVPFKPTGDRPVYCRDCFDRQR